jgi:hypothetical protein
MGEMLLLHPLVMAIVYIWAQANRETVVSFMFGLQFKVDACFCFSLFTYLGNVSSSSIARL